MNGSHRVLAAALGALTLVGCGAGISLGNIQGGYLGGTVTGLTGSGLTLQTHGMQTVIGRMDNGFNPALAGWLTSGSAYDVAVVSQPINPSQTCVVANGAGTVGNADITNIRVACTTNPGRFLYVANGGSNSISAYVIDAKSGALTPVGGSPFPAGSVPSSIAVDPSGKFAYVSNQADGTV